MEPIGDAQLPNFFHLARELRDKIYGYVLASRADWIHPIDSRTATSLRSSCGITRRLEWNTGNEAWPLPSRREYVTTTVMDNSILLVNKKIHEEASQILLEQNPVVISGICHDPKAQRWMSISHDNPYAEAMAKRSLRVAQYARVLAVYFDKIPDCPSEAGNYDQQLLHVLTSRRNIRCIRFLCDDVFGQWYHAYHCESDHVATIKVSFHLPSGLVYLTCIH
jgi:hypothetical protein